VRDEQGGVLTYAQALASGLSRSAVQANVAAGRWQRMQRATFLTHNGPPSRSATIWSAVLGAGQGAMASHATAAELVGLTDDVKTLVHVTIPAHRRIARLNDAKIHYSKRSDAVLHPSRRPAQTRIEETIFDLVDTSHSIDEAVGWLAKACGRRLTTPEKLAATLLQRNRARWRRELREALTDISPGNQSLLELRYFRHVERAHGLPAGSRQAPHERAGGRIYDDVWYSMFHTVVELDGKAAHPLDARKRDGKRDNVAGTRGDSVLHLGWDDVVATPCATALMVATTLSHRGWTGAPRRCGRTCMIM
jgi:hypothetical protein